MRGRIGVVSIKDKMRENRLKIETREGLRKGWPIRNCWEQGEGEEKEIGNKIYLCTASSTSTFIFFFYEQFFKFFVQNSGTYYAMLKITIPK